MPTICEVCGMPTDSSKYLCGWCKSIFADQSLKSEDRLNSDPEKAAKEVVDKARDQYKPDDYKIFRWKTIKEFEKDG